MPSNEPQEDQEEPTFVIPEEERMNFFKKNSPRKGDDLDYEVVQGWFKQ